MKDRDKTKENAECHRINTEHFGVCRIGRKHHKSLTSQECAVCKIVKNSKHCIKIHTHEDVLYENKSFLYLAGVSKDEREVWIACRSAGILHWEVSLSQEIKKWRMA